MKLTTRRKLLLPVCWTFWFAISIVTGVAIAQSSPSVAVRDNTSTQPPQSTSRFNTFFQYARPPLELAYYIAGVAIAIVAYKGLEQLTIAKSTALTAAKRESFKLAAEQCRYFAEVVIPTGDVAIKSINSQNAGAPFLSPKFRIEQGEIKDHSFSMPVLEVEMAKVKGPLLDFLNKVEAFAMFFTARVADEQVAYREAAIAFCAVCTWSMPAIHYAREKNRARYESTLQLFEIWNARLVAERLARDKEVIEANLKGVSKINIKPLGTE